MLSEAIRNVAHRLATELGATDLGEFAPMSEDQFAAAYRSRTVALGVESMYRMEPAPDGLVGAAVEVYGTDEARRFSEGYVEAVVVAIGEAGARLATLVVADDAPAEPEAVEPLDPASAPPCRVRMCGFLVEWDVPEPGGGNLAYGAPGEFEDFVYESLVGAGYRLARGVMDEGFTVHLRPRSQRVTCEVVSGTDPRGCMAVGVVTVGFLGSYPGFDGQNRFTVRNRCRANAVMAVRGIASLVAARIHHELTTYPGDERREPRC